MNHHRLVTIKESSAYDIAWRGLRKYHDTQTRAASVMASRKVDVKHRKNVEKQLTQLSYCLTQAYEFSKSARMSGTSTKALQAYYSLTSLANAEILWAGDGNVSLDRRNGVYQHHGLDLLISTNVEEFRISPRLHTDGTFTGLFGLWRQYSRHFPNYSKIRRKDGDVSTIQYDINSSTTPLNQLAAPNFELSLEDCFAFIPSLNTTFSDMGRELKIARGRSEIDVREGPGGWVETRKVTVQPCSNRLLNDVIEKFTFHPSIVEDVKIPSMTRGCMFNVERRQETVETELVVSTSPESFPGTQDELYFVGSGDYLNEFGYFYVGLYALGMISRYHPQAWIKETSKGSSIALLADEFIDLSLTRVPLLTLGQLDNRLFVYE